MVPKQSRIDEIKELGFRAVLFRMVPKHLYIDDRITLGFRAVLFRMVPKPEHTLML